MTDRTEHTTNDPAEAKGRPPTAQDGGSVRSESLFGIGFVRSVGAAVLAVGYGIWTLTSFDDGGLAALPHPGWLAAGLTALLGGCLVWQRRIRDLVALGLAATGALVWALGAAVDTSSASLGSALAAGIASTLALLIAVPELVLGLVLGFDPNGLSEAREAWDEAGRPRKRRRGRRRVAAKDDAANHDADGDDADDAAKRPTATK